MLLSERRKWSHDFKEGSRFQARTLINADPRDIWISVWYFKTKSITKYHKNFFETEQFWTALKQKNSKLCIPYTSKLTFVPMEVVKEKSPIPLILWEAE